ncbi:hypothetical protein AB3X94_20480 [Paraburkholderia sp. BR10923]|uniref:hypothetical protein n=1 Tax=Paraburkholderia sp. BR10923 TaxID=3236992 RepID=UPI0034CD4D64
MQKLKIALATILWGLLIGCSQKPIEDKTGPEIAALNQQVEELNKQLQLMQQIQNKLQTRLGTLEFWHDVENDSSAMLDPASKSYGVAKTNLGNLLVSVDNITPYGDGYKLRLMVGNPNMVTYDGAKLKVQWAEKPRWGDASFDSTKWNASIQSKEIDVVNELLPGALNPVEVVISPATAAQTDYLTLTATLDKLSLRRTNP